MELTDKDRANLEQARKVGEAHGYVLNPDTKRARKIANLLAEHEARYGKRFCPCKQSHPLDPENDEVCPCPDLDAEVAANGHCHCWLFFRKPEAGADKPGGD